MGRNAPPISFFENYLLIDYAGCPSDQPSQFNIQALVETELVVYHYAALRRLYNERPAYEHLGCLVVEYRLLGTNARLVEQLPLSPEERYRVPPYCCPI